MIDRDIKIFLLKVLLAASEPMQHRTLVSAITTGFNNVSIPPSDLDQYIRDAESQNLIASTNDEILGVVWELTPHGKIRAQKLK